MAKPTDKTEELLQNIFTSTSSDIPDSNGILSSHDLPRSKYIESKYQADSDRGDSKTQSDNHQGDNKIRPDNSQFDSKVLLEAANVESDDTHPWFELCNPFPAHPSNLSLAINQCVNTVKGIINAFIWNDNVESNFNISSTDSYLMPNKPSSDKNHPSYNLDQLLSSVNKFQSVFKDKQITKLSLIQDGFYNLPIETLEAIGRIIVDSGIQALRIRDNRQYSDFESLFDKFEVFLSALKKSTKLIDFDVLDWFAKSSFNNRYDLVFKAISANSHLFWNIEDLVFKNLISNFTNDFFMQPYFESNDFFMQPSFESLVTEKLQIFFQQIKSNSTLNLMMRERAWHTTVWENFHRLPTFRDWCHHNGLKADMPIEDWVNEPDKLRVTRSALIKEWNKTLFFYGRRMIRPLVERLINNALEPIHMMFGIKNGIGSIILKYFGGKNLDSDEVEIHLGLSNIYFSSHEQTSSIVSQNAGNVVSSTNVSNASSLSSTNVSNASSVSSTNVSNASSVSIASTPSFTPMLNVLSNASTPSFTPMLNVLSNSAVTTSITQPTMYSLSNTKLLEPKNKG
jgi:hypothetical protein